MKVLGIMTGTSLDGVDCCYANIEISKNYNFKYKIIDSCTFPFNQKVLIDIKNSINNRNFKNKKIVDKSLGEYLKEISSKFIKNKRLDLISIHGQTIYHLDRIKSVQVGNPMYLFNHFNIPIIYNFRSKDILLGGTGAPLMPFLDWLLYKDLNQSVITLNIGGISNITYIPLSGLQNNVLGFDTGPGMCLIDNFVKKKYNENIDYNAKYSKNGKINSELLSFLLNDKYLFKKPPKSLSVDYFIDHYLIKIMKQFKNISNEDFLRTLVNYTVKSVEYNINKFIPESKTVKFIISGGGINHPLILNDIKNIFCNYLVTECKLSNSTADFKESLLMAVMGYTCYKKIPNNMLSVTGAKINDIYGEIYE